MRLREFRQDLSPLLQQAQRAGVRDRYPQGEDGPQGTRNKTLNALDKKGIDQECPVVL